MESLSNNVLRKRMVEKDAALSTFRKIRKMVILFFVIFLICLALITGDLIIYLSRQTTSEYDDYASIQLNPAIQTYYSAADCHTESCLGTFNRTIIFPQSITNPNQILTLALQTAAKHLEELSYIKSTEFAFENYFDSLREAASQLRIVLAKMRVDEFAELLSDELRSELVSRMAAIEVNLRSCVDDLEKVVESRAVNVIEVRDRVQDVEAYISSGQQFLVVYTEEYLRWRNMGFDSSVVILDDLFVVCMSGLQVLFFLSLLWKLSTTPRMKFF